MNNIYNSIPKITSDGKRLQMVVCSATLHSFEVKRMAVSWSLLSDSPFNVLDIDSTVRSQFKLLKHDVCRFCMYMMTILCCLELYETLSLD